MQRNDVVHLNDLAVGDIFYKLTDKHKAKLEVLIKETDRITCVNPETMPQYRQNHYMHKYLKPETRVVFLRRSADAPAKTNAL